VPKASGQLYAAVATYVHIAEHMSKEGWWLDKNGKNWWNRKGYFNHNAIYLAKVGEFDLKIGSSWYHIAPGDMVFVPANSELEFFFDGKGKFEKYYVHFDLALGTNQLADHFKMPLVFKPRDTSRVEAIFSELCECCAHMDAPTLQLAANGLLLSLVAEMLALGKAEFVTVPKSVDREMRMALQYIDEHIGGSLSVEVLARHVGYSATYFTKKFKRAFGVTPTEYIANLRISFAKQYLAAGHMSVQEIAVALGFCDASYFSHFFKSKTGLYPVYYRKQNQ